MAPVAARTRVAVIGAGIVGVTTASFLLRKGHDVVLLDPAEPGGGASFGNAGCFNGSSVVPMAMPGTIRHVRKWLADPLGPLSLPLFYLPRLAPWLVRFIRAGTPKKVAAQAQALRTLLQDGIETLAPLLREAGASDLVQRLGHLFVYRTLAGWQSDQAARRQCHPLGGIRCRRAATTRSQSFRRVSQGRARARERPHPQPASARHQLGIGVPA